jgi:hypothetical protein
MKLVVNTLPLSLKVPAGQSHHFSHRGRSGGRGDGQEAERQKMSYIGGGTYRRLASTTETEVRTAQMLATDVPSLAVVGRQELSNMPRRCLALRHRRDQTAPIAGPQQRGRAHPNEGNLGIA